ncbi:MAG TPA: immunity 22 family protein [Fimbriimonadaceae bacterium]|nr:hypothetical protein [Armatimonadota bacterium]HRD30517.1 immunity 22 family protein [Fimbriimonadaceae bacterium]HRE92823.1 immunity 22 family protein [Fimbriimonadaceae bacterium]HRI72899.1 immunity 22 family protein [Fimbriimonadaceae bacterium]
MAGPECADIWVGTFPSQAALDAYFEESYSDTDDDPPISKFAQDQGERFYDHDFMEVKYLPGAASMVELLEGLSGSHHYAAAITARQAWQPEFNTVVMLMRGEITDPRSVQGEGYTLTYVGQYEFEF